jgi:hypothetical protein
MTEFYREDELDAFRALYDPTLEAPDTASNTSSSGSAGGSNGSGSSASGGNSSSAVLGSDQGPAKAQVELPTWLMFGNHDYVINVNDCVGHYKSFDRNVCARTAVDNMRSVLMPGCDTHTWANFPRDNITSFDADSLAYSFDYNNWHFVVLQYSPR